MKIRIKNYDYSIIEVDDSDTDLVENGEVKYYGLTQYREQRIKIYKGLTIARKKEAIIHELTHAYFDVYLYSYHLKDKFDEEDICCFVSAYAEEILETTEKILKEMGYRNDRL